jgi:hypothetical protein
MGRVSLRPPRIGDSGYMIRQSLDQVMAFTQADASRPTEDEPDLSKPPRCFTQPDAIHSSLWYPTASLAHPETFCFMAAIRDTSIRLIDATDGRVC